MLGKYPLPKSPVEDYPSSYADPTSQLSPLALILKEMHRRYDGGEHDAAMSLARIAAPYVHPRVQPTKPQTDLAAMPDAHLDSVRPQN